MIQKQLKQVHRSFRQNIMEKMYDEELNQDFHNWTAEYLSKRIHRDKMPKLKKKSGDGSDDEEIESLSKQRHNALFQKIADNMNKKVRSDIMEAA